MDNLYQYIKFFKNKYVLKKKRNITNETKKFLSKIKIFLRKFYIFDLVIGFLYKSNLFNFNYGYTFDQIKNKLNKTNTSYKSLDFYKIKNT